MNLVLSGPIDESLRNVAIDYCRPKSVVALHKSAYRLEHVADDANDRLNIARLCDSARVDHAYVQSDLQFSHFRLLAIDMDSTLISIECIDEMADFAEKKSEVAAITAAAMRGELQDFSESLKQRVALLAGVDVDIMRRVFEERLRLSDGASELLAAAKAVGCYVLLVSGGFTYFTDRLKKTLQLDAAFANELHTDNHRLTGTVAEPIFDAAGKANRVNDALQLVESDADHAIVIGDGANDIPMMETVNHSIAYKGSIAAKEAANHHINYGSLTTVLDFYSYFHSNNSPLT